MKTADILSAVEQAFRQAMIDNPNMALSMTVAGKPDQGNVKIRVHYERENLVAVFNSRHDLWREEQRNDNSAIDRYLEALPRIPQQPWTPVPAGMVKLTNIPGIVGRDRDHTLEASYVLSDVLFGKLEELGRRQAFMRQWRAANGGTGVEFVVVYRDDDGKRMIFEGVLNYYYHFSADKLVEALKAKQAGASESTEPAAEPVTQ